MFTKNQVRVRQLDDDILNSISKCQKEGGRQYRSQASSLPVNRNEKSCIFLQPVVSKSQSMLKLPRQVSMSVSHRKGVVQIAEGIF
jgi:hypothetical protein